MAIFPAAIGWKLGMTAVFPPQRKFDMTRQALSCESRALNGYRIGYFFGTK